MEIQETPEHTVFTFSGEPGHIALLGDIPGFRTRYTIKTETPTLSRSTQLLLTAFSGMGGSVKVYDWEGSTDYVLIAPDLPPFVSRTASRMSGRFFGKETGLIEKETVYTEYRRVTCYDDRFQVRIGPPEIIDTFPEQN